MMLSHVRLVLRDLHNHLARVGQANVSAMPTTATQTLTRATIVSGERVPLGDEITASVRCIKGCKIGEPCALPMKTTTAKHTLYHDIVVSLVLLSTG